jgi:hypothetical protein
MIQSPAAANWQVRLVEKPAVRSPLCSRTVERPVTTGSSPQIGVVDGTALGKKNGIKTTDDLFCFSLSHKGWRCIIIAAVRYGVDTYTRIIGDLCTYSKTAFTSMSE